MKSKLFNMLMFATGAVIGSVVTWQLIKAKYEQIANEEIQSVIDAFDELANKESAEKEREFVENAGKYLQKGIEEGIQHVPEKPDIMEYAKRISEMGYTNYAAGESTPEKKGEEKPMENPNIYVISPDEFGENDYPTVTLYCWADGVITDEQENVINDPESIIVPDVASHFGEEEDDSVFVRNDEQEIDYEILRELNKFSEREY